MRKKFRRYVVRGNLLFYSSTILVTGFLGVALAVYGDQPWPIAVFAGLILVSLLVILLLAVRANIRLGEPLTKAASARRIAANSQAMPLLYAEAQPRLPLPPLGGCSLEPQVLVMLTHWIREKKPKVIVELGSGNTTLFLGHVAQENGAQLHSIEHDKKWIQQGRERLKAWKVEDTARIHHAPLRPYEKGSIPAQWYDVDTISQVLPDQIDLLIVDGPPAFGAQESMARLPALPVLKSRLSAGALVVLDDYHRKGEKEIIELWREEMPKATISTITFSGKIATLQISDD